MRMAELSARSGVPVSTIKYYLRARLLPAGERIGRCWARYDERHLERLRAIGVLASMTDAPLDRLCNHLNDPETDVDRVSDLLEQHGRTQFLVRRDDYEALARSLASLDAACGTAAAADPESARIVDDVLSAALVSALRRRAREQVDAGATSTPSPSWGLELDALQAALQAVDRRWSLAVIGVLLGGAHRFTDLRRALPEIAPSILSRRLADLTDHGVVRWRRLPAPVASGVYELTPRGEQLSTVVRALATWGAEGALSNGGAAIA